MDPGGDLARLRERALGAVVRSANEVIAPGVVRNNSPARNALIVGEFDDGRTDRVRRIRQMLEAAGVGSPEPDAIRRAVWRKLCINMTGSIFSFVLGRPSRQFGDDPAVRACLARLRAEALAIAQAHVGELEIPVPRGGGEHTPSILQDFQRGRAVEIDALVRAPLAFARAAGVDTPALDLLGVLAMRKAEAADLYPSGGLTP